MTATKILKRKKPPMHGTERSPSPDRYKAKLLSKITRGKKRRNISSQPLKSHSISAADLLKPSPEEITMAHLSLKKDYNRIKEENVRYKTRNSQLETLINTLYEDLHTQQDQIEKIYENKFTIKTEFYQSSIA